VEPCQEGREQQRLSEALAPSVEEPPATVGRSHEWLAADGPWERSTASFKPQFAIVKGVQDWPFTGSTGLLGFGPRTLNLGPWTLNLESWTLKLARSIKIAVFEIGIAEGGAAEKLFWGMALRRVADI
jgi:hypothetical protein